MIEESRTAAQTALIAHYERQENASQVCLAVFKTVRKSCNMASTQEKLAGYFHVCFIVFGDEHTSRTGFKNPYR